MKKPTLTALLLIITTAWLSADIGPEDYGNYIVIPMKERVMGYNSPGFYLNIPRQVEAFYFYNDYWKSGEILEVSQSAYTNGESTAPFIKIRTDKEEGIWVFGGDVIVAAKDKENSEAWYKQDSGSRFLQIYLINGRFFAQSSSSRNFDYNEENRGTGYEAPFELIEMGSRGNSFHYVWDRAKSHYILYYYEDETSEAFEPAAHYDLSREQLNIERVMTPQDEWFWYFFENNDFTSLLDLKSRGFNKFDSPYLSREETPLFISRDKRNFEMLTFLIENGYGQTAGGGNYDATLSCLWDPIKGDDYEMVRFLLEAGIKKDQGGEMGTDWDLNYAIRYSTPQMLQLLIDGGYDPNLPTYGYSNGEDSGGSGNFLFNAIYWADLEKIKILLDTGVNVNFLAQSYGLGQFSVKTPLDAANTEEIKQLLKSYGAKTSRELTNEDLKKQKFGLTGKMNDFRVRFRDKPNLNGEVLGYFEEGEPLTVLNIAGSYPGWMKDIETWPWLLVRRENGEFGWVYGQYVDVSRSFRRF